MADFQKHLDAFEQLDTRLVAASVDSLEDAAKTMKDEGLTFPVAYGLDAEVTARLKGSYYQAKKNHLHATGFLLNPNGTVIVASYSSGAIGRLTAKDCLGLIRHLQQQPEYSGD